MSEVCSVLCCKSNIVMVYDLNTLNCLANLHKKLLWPGSGRNNWSPHFTPVTWSSALLKSPALLNARKDTVIGPVCASRCLLITRMS